MPPRKKASADASTSTHPSATRRSTRNKAPTSKVSVTTPSSKGKDKGKRGRDDSDNEDEDIPDSKKVKTDSVLGDDTSKVDDVLPKKMVSWRQGSYNLGVERLILFRSLSSNEEQCLLILVLGLAVSSSLLLQVCREHINRES